MQQASPARRWRLEEAGAPQGDARGSEKATAREVAEQTQEYRDTKSSPSRETAGGGGGGIDSF